MIGGIDFRIRTKAGDAALDACVRIVRRKWKASVFEDASTGETFESYDQIPFGRLTELFIYRDAAAAELWNEQGAVPEALNLMVHVIASPEFVTLAIDERTPEMDQMLSAIERQLHDENFNAVPLRRAG